MKKIKTGRVNVGPESFDDNNALIRVSVMLPLPLVKELKKLSLNERYSGKYQVLLRDVLMAYVLAKSGQVAPKRKASAG